MYSRTHAQTLRTPGAPQIESSRVQPMTSSTEKFLLGLDKRDLAALVDDLNQPAYRAQQMFEALYRQRVESLDEISTLPANLRGELRARDITIGSPRIENKFQSVDGTVRYLIACTDGQTVETVWMPEGDGGEIGDGTDAGDESSRRWDRATICISSQIGCAVDCQFCLTALLGVKRNLSAGEIVGQVCAVLRDQKVSPPENRINLVFMGMGEPFLNYEQCMQAVRLLAEGVGIPESRMTLSTAGIVPRIYDFGGEAVRPKLAISLNASNDELRTRLMPINKKWNLTVLLEAARAFPLRARERLTFEYVLLADVNDSTQHAREMVELIRGVRAKINLIALNPGPGIAFGTPATERVLAFQKILVAGGTPAFIRRPRGRDIYAACGQLKRTLEISTADSDMVQFG
jgi:23S rRNA (adenine2503-C2)-methyltransferase